MMKSMKNYVDRYDPWSGVLLLAEFAIFSTTNRLKDYSLGKLVFGRDTILPIKHKVDWELLRQRKYKQSNKYNIYQ